MNRYAKNPTIRLFDCACLLLIISTLMLAGCASSPVVDDGQPQVLEENEVDPYEGFNRKMYVFNDTVDEYLAEPVAGAYTWITPGFVRTGVANFFTNLGNINVVLNDFF